MFVGQNGNGDLSHTGKFSTDVRDAFKIGIATAKSTYYCDEIESSANDARKMFRVAGDLMGRSVTTVPLIWRNVFRWHPCRRIVHRPITMSVRLQSR